MTTWIDVKRSSTRGRKKTQADVILTFYESNKCKRLRISLSEKIQQILNIKPKDYVRLFVDENDNNKILIIPSDADEASNSYRCAQAAFRITISLGIRAFKMKRQTGSKRFEIMQNNGVALLIHNDKTISRLNKTPRKPRAKSHTQEIAK